MNPKTTLDFIGVGGIAYDIIFRLDKLPTRDGKYDVEKFDRLPGGLVANTTAATAKLGLSCGFVGWIGDDSGGDLLVNDFKQQKIDTTCLMQIAGVETPFTAIMVDKSGDRVILLPPFTVHQYDLTIDQKNYVKQAKYLYINFRNMKECEQLAQLAHDSGNFFVLDIEEHSGLDAKALKKVAAFTDILFLSQGVMEIAGIKHIQEIKTRGWIIVTLGSKGAKGCDTNNRCLFHQPAYKVTPVDTTGAGDTFHAACIAAHHQGKNLAQALQYGSAAAAIAVQHHGARGGLPDQQQVIEWIEKHP